MASNNIRWTDQNIADSLKSCYNLQSLMEWASSYGLRNNRLVLDRLDYLKKYEAEIQKWCRQLRQFSSPQQLIYFMKVNDIEIDCKRITKNKDMFRALREHPLTDIDTREKWSDENIEKAMTFLTEKEKLARDRLQYLRDRSSAVGNLVKDWSPEEIKYAISFLNEKEKLMTWAVNEGLLNNEYVKLHIKKLENESSKQKNQPDGYIQLALETDNDNHHKSKLTHTKKLKLHPRFCCRTCHKSFPTRKDLYIHQGIQHGGGDQALQNIPWNEPWVNEDGTSNIPLKEVFLANKNFMLSHHQHGKLMSNYNFPTNDLNAGSRELLYHVQEIYTTQEETFKINASVGMILQHLETKEYRYFVPYRNIQVFSSPITVSNHNDFQQLKAKFSELDLEEYIRQLRPNSKWKPVFISNLNYYVTRTGFKIG